MTPNQPIGRPWPGHEVMAGQAPSLKGRFLARLRTHAAGQLLPFIVGFTLELKRTFTRSTKKFSVTRSIGFTFVPFRGVLPCRFNRPSAHRLAPALVGLVLSHPEFARNGYLWGIDGNTYYCFLNPNRRSLHVWKKRLVTAAFVLWGAVSIVVGIVGTPVTGLLVLFETAIVPLLLIRHYKLTAQSLAAPVVSNGPQMRSPGDMQFETVRYIVAFLAIAATLLGALLGFKAAGVGAIFGAGIGALSGANAVAIFLFVIGWFATPFNSVYEASFSEVISPGNTNTAHIGRRGTGFSAYFLKVGDTPVNVPACGGLTPIVVAGAPAAQVTTGKWRRSTPIWLVIPVRSSCGRCYR